MAYDYGRPEPIYGTRGDDDIEGTKKDDEIYGKAGDDEIYGRKGDDEIYGNKGKDYLYGNKGDDDLYGGKGDDYLFGGQGDDHLYGGKGDDWLNGGKDNDTLRGGGGNDTFVFRDKDKDHDKGKHGDGPGHDVIKDFEFKDGHKWRDDKEDKEDDKGPRGDYDEEEDGHHYDDYSHDTLIIDYKKVYAELDSKKDFYRFVEKYEKDEDYKDDWGWRPKYNDGVDVYIDKKDLVIEFSYKKYVTDSITLKKVVGHDDLSEEKLVDAGADYYHDYIDIA